MRTVLRAMAALCDSAVIEVDDLPAAIRQAAAPPARLSEHPLEDAEKLALLGVLEQHRWHMTQTAEQLGVSRNTLYRKLRRHGIAR